MKRSFLTCVNCDEPYPLEKINSPDLISCSACGMFQEVYLFPSFFNPKKEGQPAQALLVDGKTSCFYHPHNKAAVPCDRCGRFLCTLCHLNLDGEAFCPSCLSSNRKKGTIKSIEKDRTLYGSMALSIAVFSFLMFWITFITAPCVLFIAIKYWKAPSSLVFRDKLKLGAAGVIAVIQIIGWALFLFTIIGSLL